MRQLSGEKKKCEYFYIEKSALLMFNYFTQSYKEAKTAKSSIYIRNVWRWQGRTRGAIGFA